MKIVTIRRFVLLLTIFLLFSDLCFSYSVFTHEAIIDAAWDHSIQPLLLLKYPGATEAQLKEAHAYAYGGSVAPDIGYYPFGSKLFTQLVHYVRSGDFVTALLEEANNINEYAFALGFLCHYNADKYGHPIATNHCVPLVYPKDKEKYGSIVTYEQDPTSHVRTEFGFDVLQTARGNYASAKYHDFIGFKISKSVMEKAFRKTYGLEINDIFKDFSLSEETFRWVTKDLYPAITRAAWAAKKAEIRKSNPSITRKKFEYKMRKANYYHEYGKKHQKPGFFPSLLSAELRIMPKVGPLKYLKIKIPNAAAENIFIKSFDTVQRHFTTSLNNLRSGKQFFPNIDFDTGIETFPGEYDLADKSYGILVVKLKENGFKNLTPELKQNILKFYSRCNENLAANAGSREWKKISEAVDLLKENNSVKTP